MDLAGTPSEETIKKRARVIIVIRLAIVVGVLFVVSSLTLLVVNAVQGAQTRSVLLDCTQPQGDCARDSQERTGEAIYELLFGTKNVVVYAAACAAEPGVVGEPSLEKRAKLIDSCVNKALAKEKKEEGRNP